MYLFSRLFGLFVYLSTMIFFCIVLYKFGSKYRKIILHTYILVLFTMAYMIVPNTGADLSRLYIALEAYVNRPYDIFVDKLFQTPFPLMSIYFKLIGSFGTKELLPAITAFIVYYFCFKLLIDSAERTCSSNKYVAVGLFILMSRGFFFTAISNIRSLIVLSVLGYCIYKEFYYNIHFSKFLPVYILCSLFHILGVLLFFLRIIYSFFQNYRSLMQKIINFIIILVIFFLIKEYGIYYFGSSLQKGEEYIKGAHFSSSKFNPWIYLTTFVYIIFSLYVLGRHREVLNGEKNIETKVAFRNYVMYLVVINLCFSVIEFVTFFRLAHIFCIFNVALYLDIIEYLRLKKNKHKLQSITFTLMYVSSFVFLLEASRGNLSSLKFFE